MKANYTTHWHQHSHSRAKQVSFDFGMISDLFTKQHCFSNRQSFNMQVQVTDKWSLTKGIKNEKRIVVDHRSYSERAKRP